MADPMRTVPLNSHSRLRVVVEYNEKFGKTATQAKIEAEKLKTKAPKTNKEKQ